MRRLLWLVLILAAAAAVTVVAIPTLYIQPFKPQAAEGLARAYVLRQAAPTVTAIALPIVVLSALGLALVFSGGVWNGRGTPENGKRGPGPTTPENRKRGPGPTTDRPMWRRGRPMWRLGRPMWRRGRSPRPPARPGVVRRFLLPTLRGVTILALVGVTALVTWFCRQNHFEWMFEPPHKVEYVAAKAASKFLTPDEMVMGIEVGGLSLAYPIRQMAYHHVVNDMVGTTPVVVTY